MKKVALLSLIALWLIARENPFFLPREQVAPIPAPKEQPIEAKQTKTPAPAPTQITKNQKSEANATAAADAVQTPAKPETNTSKSAVLDSDTPIAYQKDIKLPFLTVRFAKDAFLVSTKDPIKRKFMLDSPKKFVIDYAAKRNFGYKKFPVEVGKFSKLEMASHPGYYRIAVSLQGCEKFDFRQLEEGFVFRCR